MTEDMPTSDWFVFNRMTLMDFLAWREMCGRPLSVNMREDLTHRRIDEAARHALRKRMRKQMQGKRTS